MAVPRGLERGRDLEADRAARAGAGDHAGSVTRQDPLIEARALIDELDAFARSAKAIPLTTQVRLDKEELYERLDRLRAVAPATAMPAIDALDDLIHNAKLVPLTDQVRLRPAELNAHVSRIRAAAD